MAFRCLFHVHTGRSFDSILSARKIVRKAQEIRADVLIITDHNTIQGSLDAQAISSKSGPLVVMAAEYQSEKGDIIGVFLKQEICTRRSEEIMVQIRKQGGLVVLPHPYKGHVLDDGLLAGMDLIETHNARCSNEDNEKAEQLAREWNRPALAGADAHCSLELEAAMNEFEAETPENETELRKGLLQAPRRFVTQSPPVLCRSYSQMIKAVKTRDARLFLYQAKRLAIATARGDR